MTIKSVRLGILLLASLVSMSGCGDPSEASKYIAIAVEPAEVNIINGKNTSCVDLVKKKNGEEFSNSVSEHFIKFTNFRLQWKSNDRLVVSMIRVTIEGDGISGGKASVVLDEAEMEALLARAGAQIEPGNENVLIESNSLDRVSSNYAPCGLIVGGIGIEEKYEKNQTPFTARVEIEIVGYREEANAGKAVHPVRQTVTARAKYEN